ncbi:hypothetical protein ES288_A03G263800v1 [Gossypium darwinii]|uniref:Uncharacterized protein n=1 Tax=Gossypium darwinii TaxID=34276 RepID=A0A5D2H8V4_GOSDA|nr:hypothetical protein ES288_A03G263800v1 [Gossypium darwinii]
MSGSTLAGTANSFSSILHDTRECQNVSLAESEKGTSLHCYSSALSPKQPCRSKEIDNICEIMVDGFPDYHMETSNPIDTVKSGSGLGLYNGE